MQLWIVNRDRCAQAVYEHDKASVSAGSAWRTMAAPWVPTRYAYQPSMNITMAIGLQQQRHLMLRDGEFACLCWCSQRCKRLALLRRYSSSKPWSSNMPDISTAAGMARGAVAAADSTPQNHCAWQLAREAGSIEELTSQSRRPQCGRGCQSACQGVWALACS